MLCTIKIKICMQNSELQFKNKNVKKERGATFIELILYIALTAVFLSAMVLFAWDVIYARVKSSVQLEVVQNLRLAGKKIVYEIRNASSVNFIASNEICLASSDSSRNPTRIYVNSQRLRIGWGGESSDCSGLTNDEPLTGNQVVVSDLSFTDLSSGANSTNIRFSITVESNRARSEWQKSETFSGTAELRSN